MEHSQKDEEDAKKECQQLESLLRSDSHHVNRLSSIIKSILDNQYPGNAWRRDFFIKQTLPRSVQTLLKRGDLEEEEAQHINNFFQEVLEFIHRLWQYDYVELLETLTRLFTNTRCNFYQKYGKDDSSEDFQMYSDDKQTFTSTSTVWETSYFLLNNINFYGKLGGFDCIIERLKSTTLPKPNLTIVKQLIKPTFKIREILEPTFLRAHVDQLVELVPQRVLSLTDEELKNEEKKTISDISRNLEGLVRAVYPNRPSEAIDTFNLNVALKCFRSPYLEKRLAGLNDIKEFINMVAKNDAYGKMRPGPTGFSLPSVMHKNDFSCIDSTSLAQWLRSNNILEQLYGENMHPELVRRAVEIPKFLSTENMLEDKHLDLIWDASEGKHETICHLIYSSIGELAEKLPLQQLDYLYKKIVSIPFTNYSVQIVSLIRSFSIHALQSAIHNQLDTQYGNPILYELILDTTPVSHDVSHQAFSILTDMLNWAPLAHLRSMYVLNCLANLKQHTSIVMSLRLLRSLMDMSPPKRKKFTPGMNSNTHEAQQTFDLLESHDLLTLFFDDLDFFKNTARNALAQLGPAADNIDVKNAVLVGKFPYMLQIKERLSFLDHVLTSNTPFALGIPQVTAFWNNLVLGALIPEERDDAFTWLERTQAMFTQKTHQNPSEDVMFHLFNNLVPSLPVDHLSREGFAFFEHFYRYVNYKLGKLTQAEGKPFVVQTWELSGMPTLWQIALEVKDWQVARQAISLINRTYKNVAPSLVPTSGVRLGNYISECMQHLSVASKEKRELQLQRCLAMLLTILEEFETKRAGISGSRKRHGVCTQGTMMTLNWCVYSGPKSTLVTHSNETVGTIRAKASQRFDIPYNMVRLISGGQEFKFDSETLGEKKVMDGHIINIAKGTAKLEPDTEPAQDVNNLPSTIMSQQQYFQQLFDLLTFNETIGKKVWDLLMLLPTNRLMLEELSELSIHPKGSNGPVNGAEGSGVQWDDVLDASSTFKLLYSLQIVDSLLLPNMTYVQGDSLVERTEWRERFITLGGVKHLTTILMSTDFYDHARGSKRKTCLALLLKLVKYFLTDGEQLRFAVLGGCVEPHAFVGRLLDIIWGSTGDSHPQTPTVPMEDDGRDLSKAVAVALAQQTGVIPPPPPPPPQQNGTSALSDMSNLNFDNINLLPTPSPLSVEGELVRYAVSLLCAAVITQRELRDKFLAYPQMSKWLYTLALASSDESIRTEFTKGLYSLCLSVRSDNQQPHPHTVFLKHLLTFLDTLDSYLPTCEQYFSLLNKLVSDSCDGAAGGSTVDFAQLLQQLIAKVSTHPAVETRRGLEEDTVLIGLMNLMITLVSKDPNFKRIAGQKNIIHEVFEKVLFDIPTADNHGPLCPPKAKRRNTRYVAFQLLTELATNNLRNFRALTSRLMKHHEPDSVRSQWLYLPSGHEKALVGYVGLKNLGATCYMNSLMQQFFMLPAFRYGIFRADDDEENKGESLLYQMQVIFGHLQESEKKYYDMQDFCNAYKCDGQPTNTSVQMDVDEFLIMLFDRLERVLKKNNILKECFGGTIMNQVISKGCEHVSEREEGFFTLSLEVKDKKNILESLDLYVVGDMLEGDNKYFCGTCQRKVDALRRCCINNLPNTLIVHAKRFEFDLEAMKRTKLNDTLEFPMRLNLEPYTREGLARIEAQKQETIDGAPPKELPPLHPPEYYEYELAGILVHAGTADNGHYYSFVKERDAPNGNQWVYFNDTLVEPFNTEEIPKVAFGGYDSVQQLDSVQQKLVTRSHLRVNNAYMLFYDKVKPAPKPETPGAPAAPVPTVQTPSELVPRPIFNYVWEENMRFLRDKNIFDTDYFAFLWPLVMLKAAPPLDQEDTAFDHELQCIQLGTRFIVETLAHAKEKGSLFELVNSLKPLYQTHVDGSRWFLEHMLETEMLWPRQLLFFCTTQDTREVFASLVVSVIQSLIEHGERGLYDESEEPDEVEMEELDDDSGEEDESRRMYMYHRKPSSLVVRFMDAFLQMLQQAHHHWRCFGQYFLVLRDFAVLGQPELMVLLKRHLVYHLIDFYIGEDNPRHGQQPRKKMGDKFSSPNLTHMAETLSVLVRSCHTRATLSHAHYAHNGVANGNAYGMIPPTSYLPNGELQFMPNDDLSNLYHPALYAKALEGGIHQKSITEIILHLCWEDQDFSHKIIELVRNGINKFDHDLFKPYFDVFTPLLALNDSKQLSRVDEALQSYLGVIDANLRFKNATLASIRFLVDTAQENLPVRNWLIDHMDEWVENWLIINSNESIREQAFQLFVTLTPSESDPSMHEIRSKLYQYLLSLFHTAKAHTRENRQQTEESLRSTAPWNLVFFARLLRMYVHSPQDRQAFLPFHAELADLLIKCDQHHAECDENKHELSLLWAHVLSGSPEAVRNLSRNEKVGASLMDYFISIRPGEKHRAYNNSSLPSFYTILNLCCEHEHFLERVAMHRNFDWAVRFMFMETADYPQVAAVLYDMLKKVSVNPKYRQRHLFTVIQYDKHNFSFEHLSRFFELMLQTQADLIFFCTRKGLDFLTRVFERETQVAADQTDSLALLHTTELLVKATEWMLAPVAQPPSPAPSAAAVDAPPTPPTPSPAQLQQQIADIIHGWHTKSALVETAIGLFNSPQLCHFENLARLNRVIEVICTIDRSFLEQIIASLHDQLSREDDQLPAAIIAHNAGGSAELQRRRLMQHRDHFDRNDDAEEAQIYNASSAYNNFLLTIIKFALSLLSSTPSPQPTSAAAAAAAAAPVPSATTSLIPSVVDIAVLTTKNTYIQQRQPYASRHNNSIQSSILKYLQHAQKQTESVPHFSTVTSFTLAWDMLRSIWDSPIHGAQLRDNRTLDHLILVLMMDGSFLIDTHATAMETLTHFYAHCAKRIPTNHKEKVLQGLGERIARTVSHLKRDKQATGAWGNDNLTALTQLLKCVQLILSVDPELKAQFVQEHQPLLANLHEVVILNVNKDEVVNGTSNDSNFFPRLVELVQLTTLLFQTN